MQLHQCIYIVIIEFSLAEKVYPLYVWLTVVEVSGYSSRVEQDIVSFLVKKLMIFICSEMTLVLLYIWCHRGVDIMQVKDD